jgi:3-phenylpropionate/trans-cinnamate dioxygenase ferredoxin reductase subunit
LSAPASIVIVGAGQAGGWAAKTLRDSGYAGRVVLVGDEAHPPYERPPLSKGVLAGARDGGSTYLFKGGGFEGMGLEWRRGTRVARIDRERKLVELDGGDAIPYDRLILCTGGRARTLDVPGAREAGVRTLRSLDESLALNAALGQAKSLLVIGGGWIGLEVAATARKRGIDVRVVEVAPRLGARVLPPAISDALRALHEREGTVVETGRSVASFARNADGRIAATLDDGRVVAADLAVAGVGLLPNLELARDAGLACTPAGIVVDARCRTSDDSIFAAGDVAVTPNGHARANVRLESWQNAQDQGIAAAKAALGQDVRYDPLPRFWSDQYDASVHLIGWIEPAQALVMRGDPAALKFTAYALEDGRVRGFCAFNAARDIRPSRRLVETGATVEAAKLADPTVDLATL